MKKDQGITYYPAFLNVNGRKCVVVGGGQVALRKAKVLVEHGADVEVISPDLCKGLRVLVENGAIRTLSREYQEGDLKNAFATIAATENSDLNRRLVAEARSSAVLVNVVDDAANCDFILPSYLRRGEVTIAVSTGGKSPALARKIRSRLEKEMGSEYTLLANLIGDVRTELKKQEISIDGDSWQEALDLDLLLDLLKKGDKDKARSVLISNLKANQLLSEPSLG